MAYLDDILEQPKRLRSLDLGAVAAGAIAWGDDLLRYRRIVLTGMGASASALRPLWLALVGQGYPAHLVDTAELLDSCCAMVTPETLLIVASQSGRSAETVALLKLAEDAESSVVAITNDRASPLAASADVVIDILAGDERAVSTKTYVNTVAVCVGLQAALLKEPAVPALGPVADALELYLDTVQARIGSLSAQFGSGQSVFLVGRDTSLASASYGALIAKEAARWPVEAMSAAQFRHGPMELADPSLSVLVLAGGTDRLRRLNGVLRDDLTRHGAMALWVDDAEDSGVEIARVPSWARPIAEAVALQLVTVALAEIQGIEPGRFRHLSKVTAVL